MSSVSTKHVAGPATAPVDFGDSGNGPLYFVQGALNRYWESKGAPPP